MTLSVRFRNLLILLLVAFSGSMGLASQAPATRPSAASDGWDSRWLDYSLPGELVVEATTPSDAQMDFHARPPLLTPDAPAPEARTQSPRPARLGDMDVVRLRFRDAQGEDVPLLLYTPHDKKGPFPVVIALHGLTNHKAFIGGGIAPGLTRRGFAVMAPDLPLHGERPGDPRKLTQERDPRELVSRFHQAVIDVRQCIDVAETRPELNARPGVILVGYSMGAIINSVAGPADPRVDAMVLMVGGTVNMPGILSRIPQTAVLQPQLAIAHFAPRPLLMLNGADDRTITREMGQRLFAAAAEPKQQVWYESGHLLPRQAYDDATDWIAQTWDTLSTNPRDNR